MSGTIGEPAKLEHPPGLEHLTEAELTRLAANPKFGQLVRGELAWRRFQNREAQPTPPERVLEVQCRGCGNEFDVRHRLLEGVKLSADLPFTCKECAGDQSVLNTPSSEIEKSLEGKLPGQKRRVYEVLASTRASRGCYIVDYANGEFGFSEGGYQPYRREKVRQTGREWRKKNPPGRDAEYKRRYRKGDRRQQFRAVPVDFNAADAAWHTTLEQFGFTCSTPGCGRSLTLKTAIRSQQGATYVPICRPCLGRKAALKRWSNAKSEKKPE